MESANHYPYLAHWKHLGFHALPKYPPGLLLNLEFLEDYGFQRKILEGQKLIESLPLAKKEAIKTNPLCPGVDPFSPNRLTDYAESQVSQKERERGRKSYLAEERVLSGEDREQVLRGWGANNLPETRGGHVPFSKAELTFLRKCDEELRDCIKEARRADGIPLKQTLDWERFKNRDLSVTCPWLEALFSPSEFTLLTKYPQVADCALEILHRRLRYSVSKRRHSIKKRTLKDLLKSRSK